MPPMIDLTGQRFGRLTVIERAENHGKHIMWKCRCDCGNIVEVIAGNLRKKNHTNSCGCYQRQRASEANRIIISRPIKEATKKHNLSGTRLYRIYNAMYNRCFDIDGDNYKYYGGRGITICEEWKKSKIAFFEWAASSGYKDGLTLDRIDCNGNYEPGNCRWITHKEQMRNTRSTIIVLIDGKEYSLRELASLIGISRNALYERVHLNRPILHKDEIEHFGFKNIELKEREARIWHKIV